MNQILTITVGIWVTLSGLCGAQADKPDPKTKEIVIEGKPLRSLLEDQMTAKSSKTAEAALRHFCAKPEKAVPALAAALADENDFVREAAAICLGYYLKKDARALAIPPLLKALQDDKSDAVRSQAAAGLGVCGPQNKAVLAALFKALKEDESEFVRTTVIDKLIDIQPDGALPALKGAMKDKEKSVRCMAVFALGKVGESKTVIPMLIEALSGVDGWEYQDVAGIAMSQRCPEALPALCKALKDKNAAVRAGVLFALRNTTEDVWPLIRKELPAILPLLDDKDSTVRFNATMLLGEIKAVDAALALAAKLDDKDSRTRLHCIIALGRIGPDAAGAVEKISERLKSDREPHLRSCAAETLGHIGPKAKAAVPALIEALKDDDKSVRLAAIDALGNIGPDAKAAVPKLMDVMNCDDKELIRRVEGVLKKIGAK